MNTLTDKVPPTEGWFWRQTHCDNFEVFGPNEQMRKHRSPFYVESLDGHPPIGFRSYPDMCWWCGTYGINPELRVPICYP